MATRRLLLYATILALVASNVACSPQVSSTPAPGMGTPVTEITPVPRVGTPMTVSAPVPATGSPTTESQTIPGIDTPLTVEGVPLQLLGVRKQDVFCTEMEGDIWGRRETYDITCTLDNYGGYYTLDSHPREMLLIVGVELSLNARKSDVDGEVSITDENGLQSSKIKAFPVTWKNTKGADTDQQVYWLFAVEKTSQSFTLHLPGGQTVPLDRLLYFNANATSTPTASAP
jgi:hypothetical protein